MLIDTHCHIDQYPDPIEVARETDRAGVLTMCMTNLPSHFEIGRPHVLALRRVRMALGLHPLAVPGHHNDVKEFERLVGETSYVGEIGLDFTVSVRRERDLQCSVFRQLLEAAADRPRFISVHSRKAEREALDILKASGTTRAVLHWYTGTTDVAERAVEEGHFFSVNPAVIRSPKGRRLISLIPRDRILTETDGPYVRIGGQVAYPKDVIVVIEYLAGIWCMPVGQAEALVEANTRRILSSLRAVDKA